MNISDELRKLHDLHRDGALTDEEFARAKEKLLSGAAAPADPAVHQRLDELQRQNDLNRLDDEWRLERESFMLRGRHGYRYLPTKGSSVLGGVVIVLFGILWTVFAASVTSGFPGEMGVAKLFPLFGVVFILAGVGFSVYAYRRADALEQAEARYKQRRAELMDRPPAEK